MAGKADQRRRLIEATAAGNRIVHMQLSIAAVEIGAAHACIAGNGTEGASNSGHAICYLAYRVANATGDRLFLKRQGHRATQATPRELSDVAGAGISFTPTSDWALNRPDRYHNRMRPVDAAVRPMFRCRQCPAYPRCC